MGLSKGELSDITTTPLFVSLTCSGGNGGEGGVSRGAAWKGWACSGVERVGAAAWVWLASAAGLPIPLGPVDRRAIAYFVVLPLRRASLASRKRCSSRRMAASSSSAETRLRRSLSKKHAKSRRWPSRGSTHGRQTGGQRAMTEAISRRSSSEAPAAASSHDSTTWLGAELGLGL